MDKVNIPYRSQGRKVKVKVTKVISVFLPFLRIFANSSYSFHKRMLKTFLVTTHINRMRRNFEFSPSRSDNWYSRSNFENGLWQPYHCLLEYFPILRKLTFAWRSTVLPLLIMPACIVWYFLILWKSTFVWRSTILPLGHRSHIPRYAC